MRRGTMGAREKAGGGCEYAWHQDNCPHWRCPTEKSAAGAAPWIMGFGLLPEELVLELLLRASCRKNHPSETLREAACVATLWRLRAVCRQFRALIDAHCATLSSVRLIRPRADANIAAHDAISRSPAALFRTCSDRLTKLTFVSHVQSWPDNDCISDAARLLPRLEKLCVAQCEAFSHAAFGKDAPLVWPSLRELDVSRCLQIDALFLSRIGLRSAFPKLRVLRLKWMHSLEDSALQSIAQIQSLRVLDLTGCESITVQGLQYILAACGDTLEELHLAYCSIGDETLSMIAHNFSALQVLGLANNVFNIWPVGFYSYDGIDALMRARPALNISYV
ncbi:F-box/LRR-repeat protein 14 [Porphyridium purpureum]|uniref:F-box/LRR-repeat protein 14 n=1 Tax=Porphyridium purpureum TaxID=35688 RepID=A0A5J4Z3S4_PORPP|nr:F-box/LRR-repeat protein 14 [Porphyridium purpureum]|eukprot:POR5554..scf295_1